MLWCSSPPPLWAWTTDHDAWHRGGDTLLQEVATVGDAKQEGQHGVSCPDCRALVADLEAHSRWHSRLVADLAKAVENEIKRTSTAAG